MALTHQLTTLATMPANDRTITALASLAGLSKATAYRALATDEYFNGYFGLRDGFRELTRAGGHAAEEPGVTPTHELELKIRHLEAVNTALRYRLHLALLAPSGPGTSTSETPSAIKPADRLGARRHQRLRPNG